MSTTRPPLTNVAYIYALCDPDTHKVRYVGSTVLPQHRLRYHLTLPIWGGERNGDNDRKNLWVCYLQSRGKQPVFKILRCCAALERWSTERQYIFHYRYVEPTDLTNSRQNWEYPWIVAAHKRDEKTLWLDVPKAYAVLPNEPKKVMGCVPNAVSVTAFPPDRCPKGYRRYEVRT